LLNKKTQENLTVSRCLLRTNKDTVKTTKIALIMATSAKMFEKVFGATLLLGLDVGDS
jgi:hypothetical protein